jgi:hypothetical protein
MEKLTGFFKHLGTYVKGVVEAIVLPGCPHEGFIALAQQNEMIAEVETGHGGIAEATLMFKSEYRFIKIFSFIEIIDRNRPVGNFVKLKPLHILSSFSSIFA